MNLKPNRHHWDAYVHAKHRRPCAFFKTIRIEGSDTFPSFRDIMSHLSGLDSKEKLELFFENKTIMPEALVDSVFSRLAEADYKTVRDRLVLSCYVPPVAERKKNPSFHAREMANHFYQERQKEIRETTREILDFTGVWIGRYDYSLRSENSDHRIDPWPIVSHRDNPDAVKEAARYLDIKPEAGFHRIEENLRDMSKLAWSHFLSPRLDGNNHNVLLDVPRHLVLHVSRHLQGLSVFMPYDDDSLVQVA